MLLSVTLSEVFLACFYCGNKMVLRHEDVTVLKAFTLCVGLSVRYVMSVWSALRAMDALPASVYLCIVC